MTNPDSHGAAAVQPFPNAFWTANVTELFERAAYYSMASFVVIYLGQLGFGAYWPSTLNSTVLWGLVYEGPEAAFAALATFVGDAALSNPTDVAYVVENGELHLYAVDGHNRVVRLR